MRQAHDWAVVLAGGQGQRMQHLTRTSAGTSVPKQFCSLGRGPSLLHQALLRAGTVAPPERVLLTLTEAHRGWWGDISACLPRENILVQPVRRGTAIGILQPLLEILRRDLDASLVVLPSDHYFGNEAVIAAGLEKALRLTHQYPDRVLLLGFEAKEADHDLGYIVPGKECGEEMFSVQGFAEKPGANQAAALLRRGALTNSFIIAANARALLGMFTRQSPELLPRLREYVDSSHQAPAHADELARLFARIPNLDFCADFLANGAQQLAVLRLPPCGWSDLGTPLRLARVMQRHRNAIERAPPAPPAMRGQLDLAERCAWAERAAEHRASSQRS